MGFGLATAQAERVVAGGKDDRGRARADGGRGVGRWLDRAALGRRRLGEHGHIATSGVKATG